MRQAGQVSWLMSIDEPQNLALGLFIRDVAALSSTHTWLPAAAPAVPSTGGGGSPAAARQWDAWWDQAIAVDPYAPWPEVTTSWWGPPGFDSLDAAPQLQVLVRRHFLAAVRWSEDRKREHIAVMTDPGRGVDETRLVADLERALRPAGEPVQPSGQRDPRRRPRAVATRPWPCRGHRRAAGRPRRVPPATYPHPAGAAVVVAADDDGASGRSVRHPDDERRRWPQVVTDNCHARRCPCGCRRSTVGARPHRVGVPLDAHNRWWWLDRPAGCDAAGGSTPLRHSGVPCYRVCRSPPLSCRAGGGWSASCTCSGESACPCGQP